MTTNTPKTKPITMSILFGPECNTGTAAPSMTVKTGVYCLSLARAASSWELTVV